MARPPKHGVAMSAGARIRLPEEVLTRWKSEAEKSGLCFSDWVRQRIDGGEAVQSRKPTPRQAPPRRRLYTEADPALIRELARIGNNLNQIARWCNEYKDAGEAVQVLALLASLEEQLEQIVPALGDEDAH